MVTILRVYTLYLTTSILLKKANSRLVIIMLNTSNFMYMLYLPFSFSNNDSIAFIVGESE